jgi:hypothetical protein
MSEMVASLFAASAFAVRSLSPVRAFGRPPFRPRASRSEAGLRLFADEIAIERGQGAEHVEHEPAAAGGCFEVLLEAAEGDSVTTSIPRRSSFQATLVSARNAKATA